MLYLNKIKYKLFHWLINRHYLKRYGLPKEKLFTYRYFCTKCNHYHNETWSYGQMTEFRVIDIYKRHYNFRKVDSLEITPIIDDELQDSVIHNLSKDIAINFINNKIWKWSKLSKWLRKSEIRLDMEWFNEFDESEELEIDNMLLETYKGDFEKSGKDYDPFDDFDERDFDDID